jgi:hypothetical protein
LTAGAAHGLVHVVRLPRILLLAALALPGAQLWAQDPSEQTLPELEYRADRYDDAETPAEEEAVFQARPRPWTIDPWIPLNWRSNLALAPRALRSGLAFEPEATVGRSWEIGPARLITEASAFVSAVPSGVVANSSGWSLTAEATAGDAAVGAAPYATYDLLSIHDGIFGGHAVTFHTMTAGVRRRWGPTSLNLFLRRRDATIDALDRTLVGGQLSRTWPVGNGLSFNLRADAEFRRYDAAGDIRRRDLFVRARNRLFIPLSPRADLVLTADIQRNRSSERDFVTTNIIIGPAISASLGL